MLGSLILHSNRISHSVYWVIITSLLSEIGNHGATDETEFALKKTGEFDSQKTRIVCKVE